jgi:hypothetical protein
VKLEISGSLSRSISEVIEVKSCGNFNEILKITLKFEKEHQGF